MSLPPTVDLVQRDTVRLISTGRLRGPALLPLAADDRALDDLARLEGATNARLRAEEAGLANLDPRELVFGRAGRTFINAAFTHTRPGGNRFNGDDRGAWYAGFEARTALAEVAYHLTRELEAIGRFQNVTDYAELLADFFGPFHDLRGANAAEPCLDPDPAIGYPAGQALARRLRTEAASNGIVYPSVRRQGGTCLAAFRPDLVQNVREGGIWRLAWQGTPEPSMTRQAG
jgi:hypothetical protein